MSDFILPVLQFYLLIVGRSFSSNNASKENNRIIFLRLHQSKASNILKIKTAADEGEVGGEGRLVRMWGGADKTGMSNFIFSTPTFYFSPPPL